MIGSSANYYSELSRNSSIQRNKSLSPPPTNKREDPIEVGEHMFPLFPLVGTTSFDTANKPLSKNGANVYQPIRPKRPESVLSVNSISSTNTQVSKNIDSHSGIINATASAYPPVSYSQSSFDLNALSNQQTYKVDQDETNNNGNNNTSNNYLDLLGDFADGYRLDETSDSVMFQPQSSLTFNHGLDNVFSEEGDLKLEEYEQMLNGIKAEEARNRTLLRNNSSQQFPIMLSLSLQQGTQSPLSPASQLGYLPQRLSLLQRQRQLLQLLQQLQQLSPQIQKPQPRQLNPRLQQSQINNKPSPGPETVGTVYDYGITPMMDTDEQPLEEIDYEM